MKKLNTSIILFIAIIVFANLVSEQYYFRIDLTEDKQYSLSNATKNILKDLVEPVTVKAYFSANLPPNVAQARKDLEEYLVEYSRLSDNNLVYKFIDPNKDEETEMKAMQAGIRPVMINVREKDQMKQQKAYLGAIIEVGDQKEVIPFIEPGSALEYALSSSIKKITNTNKPKIGLIQGHGEPSISDIQEVAYALNILYDFIPFTLNDTSKVPDDFTTLALIAPTDSFSTRSLTNLDNFLNRGGNLFMALNMVEGDFSTAQGSAVTTGIEAWLSKKGINLKTDFVIDSKCGTVSVQQQQGIFRYNTNISFPYLPIISKFSDHPITKGLEAVIMKFASSIDFNSSDTLTSFTPLAFSSEQSGSINAPLFFDVQKDWTSSDMPLKNIIVAGVLEKKLEEQSLYKICVVSDGDFPVGGSGNQQQRLQPDNVSLMVNSIDWMSDDTGLIDLRTKGITYRPIDEIADGKKQFLKYLNFLLPILLIIIYGVIRMQSNRVKRIKIMEENYE
jgi:gliding-associated putative ABC transporter substrate-binding component GldG